MNILNYGGSQVFEMTSAAFDHVIPILIKYGIIGFICGMVTTVITFLIFKKSFFSGKRTLSIIYALLLPLAGALSSASVAGLMAAKDNTALQIEETLSPMNKVTFQAYQVYLNLQWESIVKEKATFEESIDEYNSSIHFDPPSDKFIDKQKAAAANLFVPKISKWGIQAVVNTAAKRGEEDKVLVLAKSLPLYRFKDEDWENIEAEMKVMNTDYFNNLISTVMLVFFFLIIAFYSPLVYRLFKTPTRKV